MTDDDRLRCWAAGAHLERTLGNLVYYLDGYLRHATGRPGDWYPEFERGYERRNVELSLPHLDGALAASIRCGLPPDGDVASIARSIRELLAKGPGRGAQNYREARAELGGVSIAVESTIKGES